MKKLIQGIVDFRKGLTDESRTLFAELALGQKPDTLFIACSDSRVVPNLFASTNPGDLFVLRNVGNLIPPSDSPIPDHGASAVVEFSLLALNVSDIIICGHSECGAMQALLQGTDDPCFNHLREWLKFGQDSLEKIKNGMQIDPTLSKLNQLSQVNVLQQMEHIKSYPFIQERIKNKTVRVHGWWFDIARADVYCYEEEPSKFILIDEEEAERMMKRST